MAALDVLFLDLDDTVYPHGNGIWTAVSNRINGYMVERLGLSLADAEQRRAVYLKLYGTSLSGLMKDFGIDPADYLHFVHDIDIDRWLAPDQELKSALDELKLDKYIFTNASRAHAERVLARLEIRSTIDSIIAIEDLNYLNKPDRAAFETALLAAGSPAPDRCLLVDDRLANLEAASALGWQTAWVGPNATDDRVDFAGTTILELLRAIQRSRNGRANDA